MENRLQIEYQNFRKLVNRRSNLDQKLNFEKKLKLPRRIQDDSDCALHSVTTCIETFLLLGQKEKIISKNEYVRSDFSHFKSLYIKDHPPTKPQACKDIKHVMEFVSRQGLFRQQRPAGLFDMIKRRQTEETAEPMPLVHSVDFLQIKFKKGKINERKIMRRIKKCGPSFVVGWICPVDEIKRKFQSTFKQGYLHKPNKCLEKRGFWNHIFVVSGYGYHGSKFYLRVNSAYRSKTVSVYLDDENVVLDFTNWYAINSMDYCCMDNEYRCPIPMDSKDDNPDSESTEDDEEDDHETGEPTNKATPTTSKMAPTTGNTTPMTTGKIKSNDSLSEVLELCQGVDTFNLGRYKFNELSQADFSRFFLTVKRISGQIIVHGWIEFTNTKLAIMDFPQLEDIWLVNVIITGNPNLKELLLPVINRITAGDSHGLIIANNPQLEILHFPKIEILYGGSYHYENNTTLRSIQFDRLHTVLLDRFVVLKNPALEIIEVILSRKTLDAMTILNNRNLLSIPSEFCEGNRTMTIRGNAQLSREILEELRAAANESSSQIQEFGECIFKEPVRNLAALDVCVYVYGQLDKAKFNVKKIEGCVKTQNTQLRSLSFLDIDISGCAGQHLVTGDNPILCKVDHLDSQKKIPVTFEGKYIKDCDKLCYTLNENCEFFGGQLVFNATTQHSAKKLKILKRILGGLKIDKSPAESIDFPNLEEIRVSKAPALQITDNPALKSLTMKKLPKITVDDGTKPAIKITGNKQLKQEALKQFLNELYDDWVKKTPSCEYVDSVESFISDSNCGGGESSLCDFDFSGFKAGKKGRRRGCHTTRETSTVEGSTTRGRWTTGRDGESSMAAVTTEITTTVTRETVETTTEESRTATVTQTTKKIDRETTEMTRETIRSSTTEGIPTPGERSLTSTTVPVPAGSFPYRPVIIVSALLLVFFILLGVVLWAKKRKSKVEKQLTEDLNSPSSEVSTSTISSR